MVAAERLRPGVERRIRTARRTGRRAARAGCRRRTSADRPRAARRRSISPRPSNGSSYSPVSGSQAMALMVKSRRRAASFGDNDGSPRTANPLWPAPALGLRRGSDDVEAGHLVDGEALADGVDAAECREHLLQPLGVDAVHLEVDVLATGVPCSRSRTQPPTTSARPPASRTSRRSHEFRLPVANRSQASPTVLNP